MKKEFHFKKIMQVGSVLTLYDARTCFTIYHDSKHSPLMKGTCVLTVEIKIIYEQWTENI